MDNPNAYFLGDYKQDVLSEYYNKWCCNEDEKAVFEKTNEVGGTDIYRIKRVKKTATD